MKTKPAKTTKLGSTSASSTTPPAKTSPATAPKSGRSKQTVAAPPTPATLTTPALSEALKGRPVQVHDLSAFVVLCLPAEVRLLLGEQKYQECIKEIEEVALVLTVREADRLLFVAAPFHVACPGSDGQYSTERSRTKPGAEHPSGKATKARVRKP